MQTCVIFWGYNKYYLKIKGIGEGKAFFYSIEWKTYLKPSTLFLKTFPGDIHKCIDVLENVLLHIRSKFIQSQSETGYERLQMLLFFFKGITWEKKKSFLWVHLVLRSVKNNDFSIRNYLQLISASATTLLLIKFC